MEFFLPGLFLFLVSIGIAFLVAPKATPVIASVLSLVFLTYGVYHHQKLFAGEYRLSTWQEGLKLYAPAVMILAIILFVLYGILSFFTSGQVPVPSLPNIAIPNTNSVTESVTNAASFIGNSLSDTVNNVASFGNSIVNNIGNSLGNANRNQSNQNNQNNQRKNGNNISRSILETV